MTTEPHRLTITLEATPSTTPVVARIKRLLKYSLRACGLRCVTIEALPHLGRSQSLEPQPTETADPRSTPEMES